MGLPSLVCLSVFFPLRTIDGRPLADLGKEALKEGSAAYYFMLVLSVCHTVVIEALEDGSMAYQAESPDEEALVSAAADMGFKFVGKYLRTHYASGASINHDVLLILLPSPPAADYNKCRTWTW